MIKFLIHISLSALLLLSATGMTINLHYCQDQLFDLALIRPADNCCETGMHENHCHHDADMANSNHCDDESISFESTSEYVVSAISFSFENAHSFDLFYTTPLIIDGILDEALYSQVPIDDFTQKEPNEGEPVSERTQVWVGYDDEYIYFAAKMTS